MVFYFNSINPRAPYQNIWTEQIPQMLQNKGYRVEVLDGKTDVPTVNYKYWQMSNNLHMFDRIYEKLILRHIKTSDFIIFSDALNPAALSIKTLLRMERMRCKMIGFWQDSIHNFDGELLNLVDFRKSIWLAKQEQALYRAYNHNLFFFKFFKKENLSKLFGRSSYYHTTYPSGNVYEEASFDVSTKENLIIFATDLLDADGLNMMGLMQHVYPEYKFEYAAVRTMTRSAYVNLLKRAKILMNVIFGDTHYYNAYEAMHYGCIPMVLDSVISRIYFPDELRIPSWYIEPPVVNFMRSNGEIDIKLHAAIHKYDDYLQHVDASLEKFQTKFNNDIFFKILENILNFHTNEKYRRDGDNGLYTEYKLEKCRDSMLRKLWRQNLRTGTHSEEG